MKVKLEDDGEDNSELIEEIEDSFIEEYIPLPGQYEINEYRIIDLANAQDIWEDKILPLTAKEHDILLDCYRTKLRYSYWAVSYTHLRAHETLMNLVCRLPCTPEKTTSLTAP